MRTSLGPLSTPSASELSLLQHLAAVQEVQKDVGDEEGEDEGGEVMPIFHFVQPCNRKRSHWTFNVCSRPHCCLLCKWTVVAPPSGAFSCNLWLSLKGEQQLLRRYKVLWKLLLFYPPFYLQCIVKVTINCIISNRVVPLTAGAHKSASGKWSGLSWTQFNY